MCLILYLFVCDGVDAVALTGLEGLEALLQPRTNAGPVMLQALVQDIPDIVVRVRGEGQHCRAYQAVHQLAPIFSVECAD